MIAGWYPMPVFDFAYLHVISDGHELTGQKTYLVFLLAWNVVSDSMLNIMLCFSEQN